MRENVSTTPKEILANTYTCLTDSLETQPCWSQTFNKSAAVLSMKQGKATKVTIKRQTLSLLKRSQSKTTRKALDWQRPKVNSLSRQKTNTITSYTPQPSSLCTKANFESRTLLLTWQMTTADTLNLKPTNILFYQSWYSKIINLLLRKAIVPPMASAWIVSVSLTEGTFDPLKS